MRLFLRWKDVLTKLSSPLVNELVQMVDRINAWARAEHNGDGSHGDISVNSLTFNSDTQTTVGAAGGASAQPATPLGYLTVTLRDGTEVVIAYHNKA
jgi:hypothetical protein